MQKNDETIYLFGDFYDSLNEFLIFEYGITSDGEVLERTLLKMAGITSALTAGSFSENKLSNGKFTNFDLGISFADAEKFTNYFKTNYGDQDAQLYTDIGDRITVKGHDTYFICLNSHILYTKVLPDFKIKLKEIAETKPEILEGYALESMAYDNTIGKIIDFGLRWGISSKKTDFIEETILKLAGINEQPKACLFKKDDSFTTNFYLGISLENANKLIDWFNQIHPGSAQLQDIDTTMPEKGNILLQNIHVNTTAIMKIRLAVINKLKELMKTDPDLIENYRQQSGIIKKTTKEIIQTLEAVQEKLRVKLFQRKSQCYLDDSNNNTNTNKKRVIPSLMDMITRSDVLKGNELRLADQLDSKKSKQIQYSIELSELKELYEINEAVSGTDTAAVLKLNNAIKQLISALKTKSAVDDINAKIHFIKRCRHFFMYTCENSSFFTLYSGDQLNDCLEHLVDNITREKSPKFYDLTKSDKLVIEKEKKHIRKMITVKLPNDITEQLDIIYKKLIKEVLESRSKIKEFEIHDLATGKTKFPIHIPECEETNECSEQFANMKSVGALKLAYAIKDLIGGLIANLDQEKMRSKINFVRNSMNYYQYLCENEAETSQFKKEIGNALKRYLSGLSQYIVNKKKQKVEIKEEKNSQMDLS